MSCHQLCELLIAAAKITPILSLNCLCSYAVLLAAVPFVFAAVTQRCLNCCMLKCVFVALKDLLAGLDENMTGEINHLMQEVHYCRLEAQSNVYSLAQFRSSTNENRLLVASVHGKVMSVSFQKTVPCSREVHFTYIPGILYISAQCLLGDKIGCTYYLHDTNEQQCCISILILLFCLPVLADISVMVHCVRLQNWPLSLSLKACYSCLVALAAVGIT